MAYDALNILQTLVTKTATFQGTGFDLKTGTPRRGMKVRFLISSYASTVSAGSTFIPGIEVSDDNTAFETLALGTVLTGATAAAAKEAFVSFETSRRYIRPVMNITSAATSTNSIAYTAELGIARP